MEEIVVAYKKLMQLLEDEKIEISRGLQGDCLKEYIQLLEEEISFLEKGMHQLTEK